MFELDGFTVERQTGSHLIMSKAGVARPLTIPMYPEVGVDIITANMRSAGMSRKKYFALLDKA